MLNHRWYYRRVILDSKPKLAEEIKKMENEPLLPIEKKLIAWSIIIGLALLGILIWVSYTFFPAGAGH